MLLGESVAVCDEGAPAREVQLGFAAEEIDAQVLREERAAPAVMISAHKRHRNTAGSYGLQFRDGAEMFPRNDGLVLEPEIEQIAREHQVITRLGDLVQERVKCGADGRWHLAEMRVRHDNDPRRCDLGRHGPSLGTWNHARKHITVLPCLNR